MSPSIAPKAISPPRCSSPAELSQSDTNVDTKREAATEARSSKREPKRLSKYSCIRSSNCFGQILEMKSRCRRRRSVCVPSRGGRWSCNISVRKWLITSLFVNLVCSAMPTPSLSVSFVSSTSIVCSPRRLQSYHASKSLGQALWCVMTASSFMVYKLV